MEWDLVYRGVIEYVLLGMASRSDSFAIMCYHFYQSLHLNMYTFYYDAYCRFFVKCFIPL